MLLINVTSPGFANMFDFVKKKTDKAYTVQFIFDLGSSGLHYSKVLSVFLLYKTLFSAV